MAITTPTQPRPSAGRQEPASRFIICWWCRRHASLTRVKRRPVRLVGAVGPGTVQILSPAIRDWSSAHAASPRLVDCSKRMRRPVECYGEVGRCGERSTSRVISLGAKTRKGGPQKPVPRLV